MAQGEPLGLTHDEATTYLLAGQDEQARVALSALRDDVAPERATMLGIPLICVGATPAGQELLRERAALLRARSPQEAPTLHALGEVLFWLGDLEQARSCAEQAVARWPEPRPRTSVLALQALYAALAAPDDSALAKQAQAALEASVRWFYSEGFLSQAVDAHEYLKLLPAAQGQRPTLRVRGMTMRWG